MRENLGAWYRDFQTIGRLAIQWIQTARRQTLELGAGTGWNWEARHGDRLEYPKRRLITYRSDDDASDSTSEWSEDGENAESKEGNSSNEERRLILHPVSSAYATRYPNFDAFAKQPLIDNGYVNEVNNQCQELIVHPNAKLNPSLTPLDYSNTLFTAYTTDRSNENVSMEE